MTNLRDAFIGAIVCVCALCAIPAAAETVAVESRGDGATAADATLAALVAAVEQVSGMKIEARSNLRQEMRSLADNQERSVSLSEEQQRAVQRQTGGVVKGYDVISVEPAGAGYTAVLQVKVERYSAPGVQTQERRRILVLAPVNLASLAGDEAELLRDSLEQSLAQTRRFAVVDRRNAAAYLAELDKLRTDAPLTETLRIGQIIGADYMLQTKVRTLTSEVAERKLPITGEVVSTTRSQAVADFMILDVATRQIKWAGHIVREASLERAAALRDVAGEITSKSLAGIYPLRVIQRLEGDTVVINQGGDGIKVGQLYGLNRLGPMAVDPYTKEPLGPVETQVAVVRVTRVDPKLSYAERVSGVLPEDGAESILRLQPAATWSATPDTANQGARPRW